MHSLGSTLCETHNSGRLALWPLLGRIRWCPRYGAGLEPWPGRVIPVCERLRVLLYWAPKSSHQDYVTRSVKLTCKWTSLFKQVAVYTHRRTKHAILALRQNVYTLDVLIHWGCRHKFHSLFDLHNRNSYSNSSRGRKPKVKVLPFWFLVRAFSWFADTPRAHTAFPWWACSERASLRCLSFQEHWPDRWGPHPYNLPYLYILT